MWIIYKWIVQSNKSRIYVVYLLYLIFNRNNSRINKISKEWKLAPSPKFHTGLSMFLDGFDELHAKEKIRKEFKNFVKL